MDAEALSARYSINGLMISILGSSASSPSLGGSGSIILDFTSAKVAAITRNSPGNIYIEVFHHFKISNELICYGGNWDILDFHSSFFWIR